MRTARAAAQAAAAAIRFRLAHQNTVRIMVGTGNSQLEMINCLVSEPDISWSRVEAFHLDEYVGVPPDHPASFQLWIKTRFEEKVRPRVVHYIDGDAASVDRMVADYDRKLGAHPVDLAFVGIGENGHIAFNDPHVADFEDPVLVKRVLLDEISRRQQVGEGHFPDFASVPAEAVTVTCTGLFRAKKWICCVPDQRKASAVKGSLEGPVSTACPGSMVQKHPDVELFLDTASASLLDLDRVRLRWPVVDDTEKSARPV